MNIRAQARAAGFVVAALVCGASVSWPQDYSQYYTSLHPQEFKEDFTHDLYIEGNRLTAMTREQFPHHLDLPYGTDPKQKLDLYLPKTPVARAPVLLFLHGGGFMEGDRAHYGFIARPFVVHGIVTVIASYRLTGSGAVFPAQEDDVKRAVIWLHEHVAAYGGDPDSIFVTGHSAGAVLAAEIGVDTGWLAQAGLDPRILKGIAPVSGPYDLRQMTEMQNYVPTRQASEAASPLLHIRKPVPAAVIAFGSNNEEEDSYSVSARQFASALGGSGTRVRLLELKGSGHIATAMALGTVDSTLSLAVLQMIQTSRQ